MGRTLGPLVRRFSLFFSSSFARSIVGRLGALFGSILEAKMAQKLCFGIIFGRLI